MANIKKSAVELASLVRRRLAEPSVRIGVYPKPGGWHAKVYADQGSLRDLQQRVDEAAKELSRTYDLET